MAIRLADSIDYDFAKFGFSRRQDMAVRALGYDGRPAATSSTTREPPWSRCRGMQTSFSASTPSAVATNSAGSQSISLR